MKFAKVKEMLPSGLNSLLAVAAAVLLILAFPDFEFWFLAWVALAPLLVAVDREKESVAGSFLTGWIFGLVFFFGTCWWLTFAPITYAGFPAIIAYFLLFCVCAAVAIFPGIFAAVMAVLLRRFGSTMMLVAPIVWVFSEFLRYWLTGNNWNAVGYSQAFSGFGLKFGQIGGVLMTSGVVLCGSSLIAFIISGYQRFMDDPKTAPLFIVFLYGFLGYFVFLDPRAARSAWEVPKVDVRLPIVGAVFLPLIGLVIFALVYDYGSSNPRTAYPAASVVALQPNVPMSGLTYEKWQELRQRHVRLAEAALRSGVEGYSPSPIRTIGGEEEELVLDAFDKFAGSFEIESLRQKPSSPGSTEARIWVGFAPDTTRGLLLSRNSAKLLPAIGESENQNAAAIQDLTPPMGWDEFWNSPELLRLMEFPDEPPTEWIEPANDSDVVVIELKNGDRYRRLFYSFPCGSRGENARELTRTLSEIGKKLGVEFYKCADESRSAVTQPRPVTVIFPESPMNFMYEDDAETRAFINGFAAKNNVSVLFNSAEPNHADGKFYNSAVLVSPEGREVAQYDKIYLLPFGEAVPAPLENIVPAFVGTFSYGTEYDLVPLGGAKAGIMICFESHFGELSREYVRNGADVIIEMTNDGYLGNTPVLRQHLANAVFRAVETNRPVLRVTNVGVTAYIDDKGAVLDPAPVYQEDTRVWSVAKSDGSQTFYVRFGDWFAWLCSILTFGLLAYGRFSRRGQ